MGIFSSNKKTWSNYFNNLGKTISTGTTDTLNGATRLANDAGNSIRKTTGYNVAGGTRRRRGSKPRRTMSSRNSRSRSRRK